jgi:outer membrane receptor for ferrienterochelin and colicins
VNGDVTVTPARQLTVRAGAFVNWVQDLIDIDANPTPGSGGVDEYTYRNVGRARTFGAEIDAAWRVTSRLRVEAGYAYLWTRDDTHERPLEGRPPHTVTSSIQARLPLDFELTLRYRVVTDAFLDDALRAPGFQAVDARIARELWPRSQIYAGVLNALGAQKDPARLGDQRPIEGRTIYLGASAHFPWEG